MWRRRRSKPSTRFSRKRQVIPRKSGARRHKRQRKREGPEGSLADARPRREERVGGAPVQPKSAPSPAAASSSETFSSSFFSSFFFSSFFSAAGAAAGAGAGIATAAFKASSMFTPSRAAGRGLSPGSSTLPPAAGQNLFRVFLFTRLPAPRRDPAPQIYFLPFYPPF